jgi:hypothetical protein
VEAKDLSTSEISFLRSRRIQSPDRTETWAQAVIKENQIRHLKKARCAAVIISRKDEDGYGKVARVRGKTRHGMDGMRWDGLQKSE